MRSGDVVAAAVLVDVLVQSSSVGRVAGCTLSTGCAPGSTTAMVASGGVDRILMFGESGLFAGLFS